MLLGNAPLGDAKEPSTFCPFLLLSDVALASASSFDLQSIRGTFLPVFMTISVTAFMACSYNRGYFSHLKILNPVTLQRPFVQVAHCKVSGCTIYFCLRHDYSAGSKFPWSQAGQVRIPAS